MVIGVNGAAERGCGERGEHLVHVHVRTCARSGLVHVNRKLCVVLARNHFVGRGRNGLSNVAVEHTEFGVGKGGRFFDLCEGRDVRRLQGRTRNRKVLDGTLGLSCVQGVLRYTHLTHGVVLDAELFVGGHVRETFPMTDWMPLQ